MTKQSKKKTVPTTTLKAGTTTSSPVSVSDTPGTPAPAATGSAALQTTTAPIVVLPALRPPTEHSLAHASAAYPRAGQLAAVPGVLAELTRSTSFDETFGPFVPSVSHLATDLANAAGWTTLRQALLACLLCVKSEEVYNWTLVKKELEELDVVFQGLTANNPALLAEYPATAQMLNVQKQSALRGASTRAATAKANAAHEAAVAAPAPTTTSAAAAAPTVAAGVAASGEGGVTH